MIYFELQFSHLTLIAVEYAHLKDVFFDVPKPFAGNGAIALRRGRAPHQVARNLDPGRTYRKGGCIE